MTFFARPNLSEEQFKQLEGTVLKLSGQTQIKTTTGLTLADGAGNDVIVTVVNAGTHVGDVLTFTCVGGVGKVELLPSGGAGDIIYLCKSPTTCTVGGLPATSAINGCTVTDILEKILVPTLNPSFTPPSNTLSLSPSTTTYEVGTQPALSVSATFNRGSVSPVYCSGTAYRTGAATGFNYVAFGATCPSQPTGAAYSLAPYTILAGNNTISGTVSYACGEYAKDSSGANYGTKCLAGTTSPALTCTLTGHYPWFWGKSVTLPVAGQALINSYGCKCVASSIGAITVTNYNAVDEYLWFAIPNASASRTFWQDITNTSNNGVIPGALFPTMTAMNVNSPESCWSSICYKIYISGYKTSVNYGITFS
jgi:hypothetical protein